MTAATEVSKPRRSRGFTIDSIIGNDSDTQTDTRSKTPDYRVSEPASVTHRLLPQRDNGKDSDSDNEHISDSEKHERDFGHNHALLHERLRGKDTSVHSDLDNVIGRRPSSSLHRDSVRDFNFSSANAREGIRTVSSPDNLRHIHDSFIQTAGLTQGSAHIPVSHLEAQVQAQRHFRHPLAASIGGGFPGQVPMSPQVHPAMFMNGGRDLRHMYPYIADRYPNCFLPRYGSKYRCCTIAWLDLFNVNYKIY